MNRQNWGAFLLGICSFLASCATSTSSPQVREASPLTIEKAESLKTGIATHEYVKNLFGSPGMKVTASRSGGKEYWLYFDNNYRSIPRLALGFDPKSGLLGSVTWNVRETDSENELTKAQSRFPHAKFVVKERDWSTPHSASDEELYIDESLGVTIVYEKTPKRVGSITWEDPSDARQLATRQTQSVQSK